MQKEFWGRGVSPRRLVAYDKDPRKRKRRVIEGDEGETFPKERERGAHPTPCVSCRKILHLLQGIGRSYKRGGKGSRRIPSERLHKSSFDIPPPSGRDRPQYATACGIPSPLKFSMEGLGTEGGGL